MDIELFNEVIAQLRNLPDISQAAISTIETAGLAGKYQASFANIDDYTLDLIAIWSPFSIHPQVAMPPKNISYIVSFFGIRESSSGYFLPE